MKKSGGEGEREGDVSGGCHIPMQAKLYFEAKEIILKRGILCLRQAMLRGMYI